MSYYLFIFLLVSGPVVSCIVGLSTPRFYLYGDAMDVVSGILSTGMSLRILVSDSSAAMLEKAGGYKLECRGMTPIKVGFVYIDHL